MTVAAKNRLIPLQLRALLAAAALWPGVPGQTQAESLANGPKSSLANGPTRQQWHARLAWETQDCPVALPSSSNAGGHVFEFSAGQALIQVDCRRMAYQATYYFYLQTGKSITRQVFNQFDSGDGPQLVAYRAALVTGLPSVQPAAKALFILRKYRGIGDCGQYLEYRLEGRQLALKRLRVNECAETLPARPSLPQDWPVRSQRIAPRR